MVTVFHIASNKVEVYFDAAYDFRPYDFFCFSFLLVVSTILFTS